MSVEELDDVELYARMLEHQELWNKRKEEMRERGDYSYNSYDVIGRLQGAVEIALPHVTNKRVVETLERIVSVTAIMTKERISYEDATKLHLARLEKEKEDTEG